MNPQLFLSGCGFRLHAFGEFGNESGYFFNLLSRTEKDKFATNSDIFESDVVSKLCPVSYRAINQNGGTICRPNFAKVNPDTTECVCTGKFLDPEKSGGFKIDGYGRMGLKFKFTC